MILFVVSEGFCENVQSLLFQAQQAATQGRRDQAEMFYRRVLALQPGHGYAASRLGVLLSEREQYSEARRYFQLVGNANDLFAQLWVGITYLGDENLEDAVAQFQQIVQKNTILEEDAAFVSNAYYFLGAIFAFRRDLDRAAIALEKARQHNVSDPDIYYRLGRLFHDLGDVAAAESEYQRVLTLNSQHIATLNAYGWLKYNQGYTEDALKLWNRVLGIRKDNSDAKTSLTLAYLDMAEKDRSNGRNQQARDHLRRVLVYDPNNKAAKYFLNHP